MASRQHTCQFSRIKGHAPTPPLIRVYQIPPAEIGYLTNIVEAYDGIGLVRTLDKERGIVELWIMDDYELEFDHLLGSMAGEFPMQRLESDFA